MATLPPDAPEPLIEAAETGAPSADTLPPGDGGPDLDIEEGQAAIEPPSLDLGQDLGFQVPEMAPPTLPPPERSGGEDALPPMVSLSRTPTESLEVLDPGQGASAAPGRPPPAIGRAGSKRRFQIRRASGKVFGPFEEERIVKMLSDGELTGDESVKGEDGDWEPIAEHSAFASAIQRPEAESADFGGDSAKSEAPPPARDPDALQKLQQVYGDRMAAMAVVEHIPLRQRVRKFLPVIIGGTLLLLLAAGGLSLGLTTYGVFGRYLILGPPHVSSSSPAGQALEKARTGLHSGTFGALKAAFADAERAHAADAVAVDAAGLMAQIAAALQREAPGEGTAAVGKARAGIGVAHDYGPKDPDVLRGQAALALIDAQPTQAKAILDGLVAKDGAQAENFYLLGEAQWSDRAKAIQAFKQALTLDAKMGKAHLAQADLAQGAGDLAGALAEAEKAAEVDPAQARARLLAEELTFALGRQLQGGAEEQLRGLADDKSLLSPAQRAEALALVARAELKDKRAAAKKDLEAALKIDPANRSALIGQGRMQLDEHHGAEALTTLGPIIALSAKDLEVAELVAEVQIDQGHYAEAGQTVAPLLGQHPDNAKLQTIKGIAAASAGKAEEGERILVAALKADPNLAEAHLALGKLYLGQNRLDRARAEFDAALSRAPQSSRVHAAFAELLMAQGNREAARGELNSAIAIDPESSEAHFLLGKLWRQIGQPDPALGEFRTVEKLDPKFPGVKIAIGQVLESRESFKEAASAFRSATEVDANDPVAWRLYGRALREAGDLDGSLDALHKAANLNSQDSEVHVDLALTELAKTDNAKAALEAKSAMEANAKNPDAWRAEGRVQLAIGSSKEAQAALSKALELDPSSAESEELLGETLNQLRQYGPAIDAYRKAIALDGRRAPLLLEIGQVQVRQHSYSDAMKTYKAALAHNPPFVEAYYLMARAMDEAGKTKESFKFYQLATKFEPENAMAYKYLGYYYKGVGQAAKAIASFQLYLKKKPDAEDKSVIGDAIDDLKGE